MKKVINGIELPHAHNDATVKLLQERPDAETFTEVSGVFALISDATRLKILWLLCHTEECVINIAAAAEMSSPAVSHHLRLLRQAGLIKSHKEGKEVYYTLADSEEAQLVHTIIDATFDMNCRK
ncbi:MAG: metalloregulator ArsR/SmtB family transcription factor [Eubacteriaceae bacterium]|jgi:DNA-binding transcriptional ArsR family regulator|nr:metalloregulator ArsR/SmtB family transcription factor [Eubacteriaceae bacterium]